MHWLLWENLLTSLIDTVSTIQLSKAWHFRGWQVQEVINSVISDVFHVGGSIGCLRAKFWLFWDQLKGPDHRYLMYLLHCQVREQLTQRGISLEKKRFCENDGRFPWYLAGVSNCDLALAGRGKACDLVASLPLEGYRHFCLQHDLESNDLSAGYLSNFLSYAPWLWLQLSVLFYSKCHRLLFIFTVSWLLHTAL